MLLMIIPAFAVNYLVVILLQVQFDFKSIWIVNAVLVGDVVGYLINVAVFRRFGYPSVSGGTPERKKEALEAIIHGAFS